MNLTRDRVHSIGWAVILTTCAAMTMALTMRVNAVKSQVSLAERKILALRQEKLQLETEFETRANQQQLKALNEVEFGYQAPTPGQYLEGERQLAVLAKARSPSAPSPIRVATAAPEAPPTLVAMVSPLTGKALAAELPKKSEHEHKPAPTASGAARLADRLSTLDHAKASQE
ncbi:MAG: hypothetical protein QM676_09920 [Novosphingobium sp.]